ncbi:MAG TPA: hypothetical protein DGT23_11560 [Micromonosporaceae bacterium]|nr:hypothetical protein [Micromonosporaceae bacterium]
MPSQQASGNLLSARQSVLLAFEPHEWELLTRLPARVMIAATSAEADSHRRTVNEGLAGINAIAAGADSGSDLVRAMVAAIYAEADPDPPTAEQFRDRATGINEVLVSCRAAALVLDARVTPRDAMAYREWVESIANRVCKASVSGGVLGVGAITQSKAEQQFLLALAEALRNT